MSVTFLLMFAPYNSYAIAEDTGWTGRSTSQAAAAREWGQKTEAKAW